MSKRMVWFRKNFEHENEFFLGKTKFCEDRVSVWYICSESVFGGYIHSGWKRLHNLKNAKNQSQSQMAPRRRSPSVRVNPASQLGL